MGPIRHLLGFFALVLASILLQPVYAASPTIATAQVLLHENKQLNVNINAPIENLFRYSQWSGKPATLRQLKEGSDQQLDAFRKAIQRLFNKELKILVDRKNIADQRVRLPSLMQIKHILRTLANERPAPPGQKKGNMGPPSNPGMTKALRMSKRDSLPIRASGRLPNDKTLSGKKKTELEIQFPKAIGRVTVSYSRPQVQTIDHGGRYKQKLN